MKSMSTLYSEINDHRDMFEESIQKRFLNPLKQFNQNIIKFNEGKQKFEKIRKEHDASNFRSKQFETQFLSSQQQQQKQTDFERLIQTEQERYKYDIKFNSSLWDNIRDAELIIFERNTSILNSFRFLLMEELAYHRLAEKIIVEQNNLLSRIGDYWDAKKHELEEHRQNREIERAEYNRTEDAKRFEKLNSFVERHVDILTSNEIEYYCKYKSSDILNTTVSIIDGHGTLLSKLKKDITSTIIEKSGTNTVTSFCKRQQEAEQTDTTSSNALFSFRSTTTLTRTLTCYSKKCCDKWLNHMFSDTLVEILGKGPSLEIDSNYIVPEKGKTVNEVLTENAERFKALCQNLINRIRSSTDTFPAQVRELARHMRFEITNIDGTSAGNLMLSGFIFLRIICPYITSYVPRTHNEYNRRALLNTAKILQTIANEAMLINKDTRFSIFNSFISENRVLIYKWYDDLTVKLLFFLF